MLSCRCLCRAAPPPPGQSFVSASGGRKFSGRGLLADSAPAEVACGIPRRCFTVARGVKVVDVFLADALIFLSGSAPAWVWAAFDGTKGFPGEGPPRHATSGRKQVLPLEMRPAIRLDQGRPVGPLTRAKRVSLMHEWLDQWLCQMARDISVTSKK